MSEFETQPSPEEWLHGRLLKVIREHFPDDEDRLLEAHLAIDNLTVVVDGMLHEKGLDLDQILLDSSESMRSNYYRMSSN